MVLCCLFLVPGSVTLHLVFVHNSFSLVGAAEWPPFWERAAHLFDRAF